MVSMIIVCRQVFSQSFMSYCNMQASKLRPVFKLVAANQNINRFVTTSCPVGDVKGNQGIKSWKDIPGPSSLPFIGQLLHFLPGGCLHGPMGTDIQDQLYKLYGPIVRFEGLLGSAAILFIYDADAVGQILRGESLTPIRPALKTLEYYRKVYKRNSKECPDKPTGLLTDHNEVWRKMRFMVNPIMLKPKTIKLYSNVLDKVALDTVARLKSLRDEKNMIQSSFDVEMNLWSLESTGVVALGGRLNCLDPKLPQDSPARRLIQVLHEVFIVAEELDFKPSLWRYITTPAFIRAMKLYEELEILSKGFILKAMKQMQSKIYKSDDEKSILEKLMEIDESIAVTMANDMLLAGVDTTSNTMTSMLYFLASNPEKQNKLREEIKSKQERKPYLRACIKETMRIRPVARGNMRQMTKDYNIMGYRIPKDTYVMVAHQQLSVMEEQYPRPHEYIPERWIVGKDDPLYYRNAHRFAYSPFGFGIRACIGRRIVELKLETFVSRMVENFEIGWFGPPMKTYTTMFNCATPPYNFTFKDVERD